MIISVGYRVKSLRGTQFRIWATNILKEYMQKGFALDDDRLKRLGGGSLGMERRLNKAISLLISELEEYLQMTDTMSSSIDRIQRKGEVVLGKLREERLIQ